MRIRTILLLLAFVLAAGLPACDCNSSDYITSPEADVTSAEEAPSEAVE